MQTFESARIQTAARAIGVAQSALEIGHAIRQDRKQFGKSLIELPARGGKAGDDGRRDHDRAATDLFPAWQKDHGKRCDLEAGMAKLLGARVAWAAQTTPCRSTAATALRWNIRSAGSCVTRAF